MDSIIFHTDVNGHRIKYYAKTYRENSSIIWYNPEIEKYEIFDNFNQWINFLDKNLEDKILEDFGQKMEQDWNEIKEEFDSIERIKEEEDYNNSFLDNFGSIFKSLETLGF